MVSEADLAVCKFNKYIHATKHLHVPPSLGHLNFFPSCSRSLPFVSGEYVLASLGSVPGFVITHSLRLILFGPLSGEGVMMHKVIVHRLFTLPYIQLYMSKLIVSTVH